MSRLGAGALVLALSLGMAGLLAGDAVPVGVAHPGSEAAAHSARAHWAEVKWPFALDQWGLGRAFRCADADCGTEITVYLRAKIGFCNCATGVSDDDDLDRVGDLELFSDKFVGLADGEPINVGWMNGRSRLYHVAIPYAAPRDMLAIGFNDKCDVAVATVVADRDRLETAGRLAVDFLNSEMVLRWAGAELGAQ